MSDQIRTLQGRIDIVFGKEEQDNGVSVFPSNDLNGKEIDSALKKALLSLNDMTLDEPIFHLNSTRLYRGARLIGKKQLYINTIGNDGVTLRYSFARSRGIAHWTIAGIKYDYKKYSKEIICSNYGSCGKEAYCWVLKREAEGAYAIEIASAHNQVEEPLCAYPQINEVLENMARLTLEAQELKNEYEAKYSKVIEQQEAMLAELKKIAKSYNLGISLFNINTEVNKNENKG